MLCMKCGKKTGDTQVFCDSCLAQMSRYPVKPDVRIQIPVRPTRDKKAPSRNADIRPETLIRKLRGRIKRLRIALLCAVLALALAVGLLFHTTGKAPSTKNIGKNYTADTGGMP